MINQQMHIHKYAQSHIILHQHVSVTTVTTTPCINMRLNISITVHLLVHNIKKVKQSRYRPGVAQRVPGS